VNQPDGLDFGASIRTGDDDAIRPHSDLVDRGNSRPKAGLRIQAR